MQQKRGFTLIEVVIVMAIIAVLAALVVGAITIARKTATETTNRNNAKTLNTCLEAYYARFKAYCDDGKNNVCHDLTEEPEFDGLSLNTIAEEINADGIPCTLSKTSTKPTWCSGFADGCSGSVDNLAKDKYRTCVYNYKGSACMEYYPE